ncbi:hypothetical protein ABTE32_23205, partial [Acinetobacter baumannii]
MKINRRAFVAGSSAVIAAPYLSTPVRAQIDAARRWIDNEFQPSVRTKDQQAAELEWFIKA